MKAIKMEKYDSPETLHLVDTEKPVPNNNEVLIKVHTSTINSYDYKMMKGNPFMIRFQKGLLKPKKDSLGCDVAGIVEEVGKNVTKLKVGDNVFGCLADGNGDNAYSEYVCVNENILAIKPNVISFEEIVTIPMAGLTALQAIRDYGQIKKGQKVLINGASGGVGTFAVQIAKAYGAEVTGVCRTENLEMVSAIGADYVIDYTKENFIKMSKKYDLIIDTVANHTFSKYKPILSDDSTCVMVGFSSLRHMLNTGISSFLSKGKNKKIKILLAQNTRVNDLIQISKLVENKEIQPVIDKIFFIQNISKAFQYFEAEHIKGKLVISINGSRVSE